MTLFRLFMLMILVCGTSVFAVQQWLSTTGLLPWVAGGNGLVELIVFASFAVPLLALVLTIKYLRGDFKPGGIGW